MDTNNNIDDMSRPRGGRDHRRGKVVGGLIIVVIGGLLLARELGTELPWWVFKWEWILIVLGIYVGIKHRFHNPGWLIPIVIGGLFLADDICPDIPIGHFIWPVLIILFGLITIFKPRRRCEDGRHWRRWEQKWKDRWEQENNIAGNAEAGEDMLETVCVFGGVKKHVISKNFKGGEITCIFGGAEINLMRSDFTGKAVMEFTMVMGGAKLIVPSHWQIEHHELIAVMGGIEDKREITKDHISDAGKILVLKGTCFLGGLEIRSY